MERVNIYPLSWIRTDTGRKLRKAYEKGIIHHGFNEYREMQIDHSGICHTISTVTKDFLICEEYGNSKDKTSN